MPISHDRLGREGSMPRRRAVSLALLLAATLPLVPAAAHALETPPPAIPLAGLADARTDPAPYWVSEKLDGVRAVWDGSTLRFRRGQIIHAPDWFLAALPHEPLDGELWMGRRTFERLSGIVRKEHPVDEEWRQVRYMVFELPGAPGDFTQRQDRLGALVAAAKVSWFGVVEQFRVADRQALKHHLDEVVRGGGEGLMLHRADAPWLTGRNDALLKLKPMQDAEARVVAYEEGQGKYSGMVGALEVEAANGRRFRIGSGLPDELRRNPPPIGTTITYRYRDLTANGQPRFATYWRVRDLP
jgi:DNA ligase